MQRITLSLEDDQYHWLESEADRRGVSKSAVARDVFDNRSGESSQQVVKRLEAIERILCEDIVNSAGSGEDVVNNRRAERAPAQNAQSDAQSDSSSQTMNTLDRTDQTGGSAGVDAGNPPDDRGELIREFRQSLEGQPPQKIHAKDATARCLELLRENGTMQTSELQRELFDEFGENYSSERALWESISRYFDELPGFDKTGYGEWGYAGDDDLRDLR